jgi:serine/threonine protein kinase/Flp pilus assembly protein TadD
MSADFDKLREIFLAALEQTPEQRDAYLDLICAGDEDLRRNMAVMLKAQAAGEGPLDRAALRDQQTGPCEQVSESPGTVIGSYKLIEPIGEGGMGTVWMAQQTEPVKRLVAVKLIKAGMDSRQVIARFEAERQALALMDHPNIAKVHDAGATPDGRPYFVMELVKGVPLTKYCNQHRLMPRQRLELFIPVCQAIQHAHQKGIIHRDIKPSNVLVALYDGRPVPKVIDFGIAKAVGQQLTEHTLVTGFGTVVGTLEYMSPEQAEINQLDIDTRSDVYSLGVLLYELLTGTTPLEKKRLKQAAILELLRVIREEEPPRPSTRLSESKDSLPAISAQRQTEPAKLTRLVRGELDWIVMKALEKDRNRRYESASAFAADVQRYLCDETVLACPPSAWYRLGKFARRHKTGLLVAGLVLFFVALLAGGGGWVLRDREARQARATNDLELALERAELFQGEGKRAEALAAFERAEMLAGQAAPDPARSKRLADLKERLAAAARDREFMDAYEKARRVAQSRVDVKASRFISEAVFPELLEALRRYGIEIGVMTPAQVAARVEGRPEPVRGTLIAALDECFVRTPKEDARLRQWLFDAVVAADDDPWRKRVRKALFVGDGKTLEQQAREVDASKQPAGFLIIVADNLAAPMKSARLDLLRRIQHAHADDLWANHNLAWVLQENGQPAEAIRYYTAMLALRPANPGIYLNRGRAYRDAREMDAAIADLRKSVALAPRYATAHYLLGTALVLKGDLDGASAAYRRAIALKPSLASAHDALGVVLERQGQVDQAIASYRLAIRHNPKDAGIYYNLGGALLDKGLPDQAIAAFRQAIHHQRDYAEAHRALGISLQKKGKLAEASAAFRQAVRHKPDYSEAHYDLGATLVGLEQLDQAIAAFCQAVHHKPNYAEAHYNLGITLMRLVELDQAIAAFRQAIRHRPDNADFHYALGFALVEKGEQDSGIAAYREAIRLKPDHTDALHNLGQALRRTGQLTEALAVFRALHNPPAHYVQKCEREIALQARLPALLRGKDAPASARECLELAYLCMHRQLCAAAARFFVDAFKAAPALAANLEAGDRFGAARAAALAGTGQGKDADQLDDAERARWRRQALEWLQADLDSWGRLLNSQPGRAPLAADILRRSWLVRPDLRGVRGPEALARLPKGERPSWQKLWDDVADTLARAQRKTPPRKKSNAK